MAKTGRPRKDIPKDDFESLLAIQCSLEEIQAFFERKLNGCSIDTIERWCRRTYGCTFAEIASQKRAIGKISLRRAQFRLAEKNVTMNIWLSKQYLGQSDSPDKEKRELELRILRAQAEAAEAGSPDPLGGRQVIIINDTAQDAGAAPGADKDKPAGNT